MVDRYANHIYYGGATGMALVVIDGNQRVFFCSFGETRPGIISTRSSTPVIRIASLSKLMTSEMLVKLLDQGG